MVARVDSPRADVAADWVAAVIKDCPSAVELEIADATIEIGVVTHPVATPLRL